MATVIESDTIKIDRLELGPFGTNSYILTCKKTNQSAVVDAPGEAGKVSAALGTIRSQCILITHDHHDHLGGLAELKSALQVPVAAHPESAGNLPVAVDILLDDGDEIAVGATRLKVIHTPGHTRGSLCFHTDHYLISGDTLFPGGPGRTQSPADFGEIIDSITQKLFKLHDDTRVFPGHGDATTIGREKKLFEIFSKQPRRPDLCGDVSWTGS